ncbi:MAG: hypothetical protein AAF555_01595 [Verrucomicrobiota bacterium]
MREGTWWKNPIFRRYVRSRLRWQSFFSWGLVMLLLTGFVYLLSFLLTRERLLSAGMGEALAQREGFRATLLPLLVVQGIMLLLMGTGAVASGIGREREEGMVDYQRLTPLSPATKALGYLFGLPVREYAFFLLTVPFLVATAVGGAIPLGALLRVYSVFFASACLYHLTGLVAGLVLKRSAMAARGTQFLVVVLYLLMPRFSDLGISFFEYLTVRPVALAEFQSLLDFDLGDGDAVWLQGVPLFHLEVEQAVFSLLLQTGLAVVLFAIVRRRWARQAGLLLGKNFALGAFSAMLLLLVGHLIPMVRSEALFELRSASWWRTTSGWGALGQTALIGLVALASFGMLVTVVGGLLTLAITPGREMILRGLRRARKRSLKRLSLSADESPSGLYVLGIVGLVSLAWWLLARELSGLPRMAEALPSGTPFWSYLLVPILAIGLAHWTWECFGPRGLFVLVVPGWILPPMVGVILISAQLIEPQAVYLLAWNPVTLCFFQVFREMRVPDTLPLAPAYWLSLAGHGLAWGCLGWWRGKMSRRLQQAVASNERVSFPQEFT